MNEINPEYTRSWQRWKATATEWLSVIIASAAMFVSLVALIISIHSSVRVSYMAEDVAQLREEVDVLGMREAKIQAWLDAHGVEIE